MRHVSFTLVLSVVAIALGLSYAQDAAPLDLPILSSRNSGIQGTSLLFNRYGERDLVLRGNRPVVLWSVGADGARETLLSANALSSSAADGKWLFAQVWTGSQVASHLFNLDTGQSKTIPVAGVARKAALSGNKLALLVGSDASGTLVIYDCDSGLQQFSIPVTASAGDFLSFSRPDRLLLIESEKAQITPISVGDSLTVQDSIQLSGPWIENALTRAKSIKQRAKPIAATVKFGISVVTAHVASSSGNDLFFLLGSTKNEGARLIEVENNGRILGTYRLYSRQGISLPRQGTIREINNRLVSLDPDGFVREYRRP